MFVFLLIPGTSYHGISLNTAQLAATVDSLCRDRVWGMDTLGMDTSSSKFGRAASRLPFVTRACAVCSASCFFSSFEN